ncbi:hypothetical protein [Pollutibacter soli]|uniref:hypothetical protein n=1 Tax=Pollutibacter soli TaxID=3034157 RepID=UPI00301369D4
MLRKLADERSSEGFKFIYGADWMAQGYDHKNYDVINDRVYCDDSCIFTTDHMDLPVMYTTRKNFNI